MACIGVVGGDTVNTEEIVAEGTVEKDLRRGVEGTRGF